MARFVSQGVLNYFGVNASRSLAEWRRKGWIHPQNPRAVLHWAYDSRAI